MYRNNLTDPYDPSLTGTALYGHNGEGDFGFIATMTLIEFGILLATLLPYSFSRYYWVRTGILQILFVFWLIILGIGGMHSGGIYAIHLIWILAINVILFVLLILSGVAEYIGRNKKQQPANY